jgi:glycosyltransferase involved in cell wall biosynthesis
MRILHCLYYYRPHYSGLTVYTERLARALVQRGHSVTVLTSRYSRSLPAEETLEGVRVRRVGVATFISKGPIMPAYQVLGCKLAGDHEVVHLHVPQIDAAPLALWSRLLGKPVVMTFHCDLSLPRTPLNWLANGVSHLADQVTAGLASAVVTNTRDYAEASPLLKHRLDRLVVIPPPIEVMLPAKSEVHVFRARVGVQPGQRLIGMAARLATEKGAEVLARAMPMVLEKCPQARVLYVGQHENVMGEEDYARRLQPLLDHLGDRWTFLGVLPARELGAFYAACDVTVLPSLNRTESFGMVQIESMACGTPVVASDIPGVRQPTMMTGMGKTVPAGDSTALAQALLEVFERPERYAGNPAEVEARFSSDVVAAQYESLYASLQRRAG